MSVDYIEIPAIKDDDGNTVTMTHSPLPDYITMNDTYITIAPVNLYIDVGLYTLSLTLDDGNMQSLTSI